MNKLNNNTNNPQTPKADTELEDIILEIFSNGRDELTSDCRVEQYREAINQLILEARVEARRDLITEILVFVDLENVIKSLEERCV